MLSLYIHAYNLKFHSIKMMYKMYFESLMNFYSLIYYFIFCHMYIVWLKLLTFSTYIDTPSLFAPNRFSTIYITHKQHR